MEEHIAGLREAMNANGKVAQEALREIQALREDMRNEVKALAEKHTTLETSFAEAKATFRGVKIGWAAAFMFIGAGIVTGWETFFGLFK